VGGGWQRIQEENTLGGKIEFHGIQAMFSHMVLCILDECRIVT